MATPETEPVELHEREQEKSSSVGLGEKRWKVLWPDLCAIGAVLMENGHIFATLAILALKRATRQLGGELDISILTAGEQTKTFLFV